MDLCEQVTMKQVKVLCLLSKVTIDSLQRGSSSCPWSQKSSTTLFREAEVEGGSVEDMCLLVSCSEGEWKIVIAVFTC